ncbi:MAG: phosphotransferase [Actinomycetota bacterium]
MVEPIHDRETDTGEGVVRALLRRHLPGEAGRPLTPIRSSGTDNAMWRLAGSARQLVVRLPRMAGAAAAIDRERWILGLLADDGTFPLSVPEVVVAGEPGPDFPHPWLVLGWLDGDDAWATRNRLLAREAAGDDRLAIDLAAAVRAIRSLDGAGGPSRPIGQRGGPIGPVVDEVKRWLDDPTWSAGHHLDVAAVRRAIDEAGEADADPIEPVLVHGDLLPGNLLVGTGRTGGPSDRAGPRLSAIIDWGSAALADPAQDLTPAWAVLGHRGRLVFREALGVDEATWLRGRAFELQHAVGAILYYRPRRHPLADVMANTLDQLLGERTDH